MPVGLYKYWATPFYQILLKSWQQAFTINLIQAHKQFIHMLTRVQTHIHACICLQYMEYNAGTQQLGVSEYKTLMPSITTASSSIRSESAKFTHQVFKYCRWRWEADVLCSQSFSRSIIPFLCRRYISGPIRYPWRLHYRRKCWKNPLYFQTC